MQRSIAFYGGYGYNNEYDNNYGGSQVGSNSSWGSGSERQSLPRNTVGTQASNDRMDNLYYGIDYQICSSTRSMDC